MTTANHIISWIFTTAINLEYLVAMTNMNWLVKDHCSRVKMKVWQKTKAF